MPLSDQDLGHLDRAIELARAAENGGNLPIGAVVVLDGKMIAEGANSILRPQYHPGRHAEMEALQRVPLDLWPRAKEMTCYTTMEPCTMCLGALVLHRVGRIIFGAYDKEGGATSLLPRLPKYVIDHIGLPELIGPVSSQVCEDLCARTFQILANTNFKV
ncbi:MAG: nucleoside deaminase [Ignavibacteriae bacterium]|nr:nucleoside deaminase [Ignavibacteriota bacterium]